MSYLLLVAGLLAIAIVLRIAGEAAARRRGERIPWRPSVLAGIALIVLTIVFDNVMIAAGLFTYADAHISGVRIGLVPIEDLSYPLALVIALPGVWQLLRPRLENPGRRHGDA
ncbi:MAG: lycopene cyclase domain-containing protein [Protaetiibacter sp.]